MVMNVAGDAAALVFLRGDHPAEHLFFERRLFGFQFGGLVAADFYKTLGFIISQELHNARRIKARAVFAHMPALVFGTPVFERRRQFFFRNMRQTVFGRENEMRRFPKGFFFGITKNLLRALIPARYTTFDIIGDNRVIRGAFEDQIKLFFGLVNGVGSPATFGIVNRHADDADNISVLVDNW